MSAIEQDLFVQPPVTLRPGHMTERMESRWHECPLCHRVGRIMGEDEQHELVYKCCPMCEGSGRLKAEVTVHWVPERNGHRE
jgi:hypothetical protein